MEGNHLLQVVTHAPLVLAVVILVLANFPVAAAVTGVAVFISLLAHMVERPALQTLDRVTASIMFVWVTILITRVMLVACPGRPASALAVILLFVMAAVAFFMEHVFRHVGYHSAWHILTGCSIIVFALSYEVPPGTWAFGPLACKM